MGNKESHNAHQPMRMRGEAGRCKICTLDRMSTSLCAPFSRPWVDSLCCGGGAVLHTRSADCEEPSADIHVPGPRRAHTRRHDPMSPRPPVPVVGGWHPRCRASLDGTVLGHHRACSKSHYPFVFIFQFLFWLGAKNHEDRNRDINVIGTCAAGTSRRQSWTSGTQKVSEQLRT